MDIQIKNNDILFKVRVSGIIIINNKLLVDKYNDTKYCLPGGYVELGETTEEGLIREIKEEVNVDVNIDSFMGIMENFFYNRNNIYTQSLDFYYKVSPKNINDINLEDYEYVENDKGFIIKHEFKWIDINKLDKFNLVPDNLINIIKENKNEIFHLIKR